MPKRHAISSSIFTALPQGNRTASEAALAQGGRRPASGRRLLMILFGLHKLKFDDACLAEGFGESRCGVHFCTTQKLLTSDESVFAEKLRKI
jgi:hypothetical protein